MHLISQLVNEYVGLENEIRQRVLWAEGKTSVNPFSNENEKVCFFQRRWLHYYIIELHKRLKSPKRILRARKSYNLLFTIQPPPNWDNIFV